MHLPVKFTQCDPFIKLKLMLNCVYIPEILVWLVISLNYICRVKYDIAQCYLWLTLCHND